MRALYLSKARLRAGLGLERLLRGDLPGLVPLRGAGLEAERSGREGARPFALIALFEADAYP